jgi:hypothetical protein
MTFMHAINKLLDQLYFALIEPLFVMAGWVLDAAILTPLDLLHVPQSVQVMAIAFLTGLLSLLLRGQVGLEKHERLFRRSFAVRKKDQQSCMQAVSDDKAREIIQQVGDDELDTLYNNYLARRFVENGVVYMLPVLTALLWMEKAFPAGLGSAVLLFLTTYFLILFIPALQGKKYASFIVNLFQRSP